MSNQNPLSPFDPHSDLPEAGQSPWPQGRYGDPGYGTTQYGIPQDVVETLPIGKWQQEAYRDRLVRTFHVRNVRI